MRTDNSTSSTHPFRLQYLLAAAFALLIASIWPEWAQTETAPATRVSEDKRFIDNGDGTVTDTRTGLMWMQQDSYQHKGHWMDWFQAFEYVNQLNQDAFADHIDWKVPTVKELQTLFDPDKFNSAQVGTEMNLHMDPIFAPEGSGSLWTTETNGRYNAFGVVFNTGDRFSSSKKSKGRRAVRAVRQAAP